MAITNVMRAAGSQSKTTGTSLATGAELTCNAGDVIVVCFASDDAAGTYSVADNGGVGNSYVLVNSIVNSGAVASRMYLCQSAGALSTATLTVTHPSLTARAMQVGIFRGVNGPGNESYPGFSSGTTFATSVTDTAHSDGLAILMCGAEGPIGDAYVIAAGVTTMNSGGAVAIGTSGQGATSNITVGAAYLIRSSTTDISGPWQSTTTRNWASCSWEPAPLGYHSTTIELRTVNQAVSRAANW